MSDLITGHLLQEPTEWPRLNGLPKSIACRVLAWEEEELWFIETFPAPWPHRYRFGHPVAEPRLFERVRRCAPPFAHAADVLSEFDYEGAEALGTLTAGAEIASILGWRLFSFISDTDTLDLCCTCDREEITRIRHLRHNLDLLYSHGRLLVQPLVWEEDDLDGEADEAAGAAATSDSGQEPAEALLAALRASAATEVADEVQRADLMAHSTYAEELAVFLGPGSPVGEIDPREIENLKLVFENAAAKG